MMCTTQTTQSIKDKPPPRQAVCSSCGQPTTLTYVGEQRWPARVAERLGVAPVAHLWRCERCQTTLTLQDRIQK